MNNLSIHEALFGRLDESLYWGIRGFSLSGKTGNDYYHVAIPLLILRDDESSRKLLLDGERRFPEMSRVQMMLATLDFYQGRPDQARARSSSASARAPGDEELMFLKADLALPYRRCRYGERARTIDGAVSVELR
jgi:hypothetical protein